MQQANICDQQHHLQLTELKRQVSRKRKTTRQSFYFYFGAKLSVWSTATKKVNIVTKRKSVIKANFCRCCVFSWPCCRYLNFDSWACDNFFCVLWKCKWENHSNALIWNIDKPIVQLWWLKMEIFCSISEYLKKIMRIFVKNLAKMTKRIVDRAYECAHEWVLVVIFE